MTDAGNPQRPTERDTDECPPGTGRIGPNKALTLTVRLREMPRVAPKTALRGAAERRRIPLGRGPHRLGRMSDTESRPSAQNTAADRAHVPIDADIFERSRGTLRRVRPRQVKRHDFAPIT